MNGTNYSFAEAVCWHVLQRSVRKLFLWKYARPNRFSRGLRLRDCWCVRSSDDVGVRSLLVEQGALSALAWAIRLNAFTFANVPELVSMAKAATGLERLIINGRKRTLGDFPSHPAA